MATIYNGREIAFHEGDRGTPGTYRVTNPDDRPTVGEAQVWIDRHPWRAPSR